MADIVDPLPGIIQCLKLNSDVDDLVAGRVYGEELPRDFVATAEQSGNDSIPKAVVVSTTPGGYGLGQRSTVGVVPFRIDLRCYGESPYQARRVHFQVSSVLKRAIGVDFNATRYYRFIPEISGMFARDPDTNWPFIYSSWDVWASEFSTIP